MSPTDFLVLTFFRDVSYFSFPDFTQEKLEQLESYLKVVNIFRTYEEASEDPQYSEVISHLKSQHWLCIKVIFFLMN